MLRRRIGRPRSSCSSTRRGAPTYRWCHHFAFAASALRSARLILISTSMSRRFSVTASTSHSWPVHMQLGTTTRYFLLKVWRASARPIVCSDQFTPLPPRTASAVTIGRTQIGVDDSWNDSPARDSRMARPISSAMAFAAFRGTALPMRSRWALSAKCVISDSIMTALPPPRERRQKHSSPETDCHTAHASSSADQGLPPACEQRPAKSPPSARPAPTAGRRARHVRASGPGRKADS